MKFGGGHFDLVIRGGTVVDGSGAPAFAADVAIKDGLIVKVGEVAGVGAEEIDATGAHVLPGFVDIHTHYDGQVTWSDRLAPSNEHGVTTVVIGNCGVGFAPCRPEDRERLLELMEGVEDIPGIVLAEGLPWSWETYPEYLDFLASRSYDVDIAAMIPHAALRLYVMGKRGADRELATKDDIGRMADLLGQALDAGAYGFSTTINENHRTSKGESTFTRDAGLDEFVGLAGVMRKHGGIFEASFGAEGQVETIVRFAQESKAPVSFALVQNHGTPEDWKRELALIRETNQHHGTKMRGQVLPRQVGAILGLEVTLNPFSPCPAYQPLAGLPLADKVSELRKPEVRRRLIREATQGAGDFSKLGFLHKYDLIFPYSEPARYDWSPEESVGGLARAAGVSGHEMVYDLMLKEDGAQLLFCAVLNYSEGNLDVAAAMLRDPDTVVGIGDGGAHYGIICDASYPSFMLSYFGRDAPEQYRISVEALVKKLSLDNAEACQMSDRGLIREGYRADVNVIDLDGLTLHAPKVMRDLPAGGRRLLQHVDGYLATLVGGVITRLDGEATGALPGRLMRRKIAGEAAVQAG